MKLIYGTTSSLVVTITERFYNSVFSLYFADTFNAWPTNPPSSNPFQIFQDFTEIVKTNDRYNPKYIAHRNGVRRGIQKNLTAGSSEQKETYRTINIMGTKGLEPYLAILECDTYTARIGSSLTHLPPSKAGSPTSLEYLLTDVQGPKHPQPEMHLQKLHF